jgi:hypothetical protein
MNAHMNSITATEEDISVIQAQDQVVVIEREGNLFDKN